MSKEARLLRDAAEILNDDCLKGRPLRGGQIYVGQVAADLMALAEQLHPTALSVQRGFRGYIVSRDSDGTELELGREDALAQLAAWLP